MTNGDSGRPAALGAIGNTPIVQLTKIVGPESAEVWVKLEAANPTGSYKDRMALAMIEGAERSGRLRSGQTVVEYTGGSTGSSLSFVCAVKGYPTRIVTSDAFAAEKLATMHAFGATSTCCRARRASRRSSSPPCASEPSRLPTRSTATAPTSSRTTT
jgi:cysteine synthase A